MLINGIIQGQRVNIQKWEAGVWGRRERINTSGNLNVEILNGILNVKILNAV